MRVRVACCCPWKNPAAATNAQRIGTSPLTRKSVRAPELFGRMTRAGVSPGYWPIPGQFLLTKQPVGDATPAIVRRIQHAGAVYHVMNRGDRREAIFGDNRDRRRFQETLGATECSSLGSVALGRGGDAEVGRMNGVTGLAPNPALFSARLRTAGFSRLLIGFQTR